MNNRLHKQRHLFFLESSLLLFQPLWCAFYLSGKRKRGFYSHLVGRAFLNVFIFQHFGTGRVVGRFDVSMEHQSVPKKSRDK